MAPVGVTGKDGLLEPSSPRRRKIAELAAQGYNAKQIADALGANYDYVRKALKHGTDIRAHILRLKVQGGAPDAVDVVDRMKTRDWKDLAPLVQRFYAYVLERALSEPTHFEQKVGETDDGQPILKRVLNPLSRHFTTLAVKVAERVEERAWGKVPDKVTHELGTTIDDLKHLKDHQLVFYRKLVLSGTSPALAFEEARRLPALLPAGQRERLDVTVETEAIEGVDYTIEPPDVPPEVHDDVEEHAADEATVKDVPS